MEKKRLNPWSMVAALCAVGICPLFSIAAIFAGFRALVEIKARGDTRGTRLALFSMLLGATITGLWGGGMLWWNANVRSMIEQGPIEAISQGQLGDIEEFEGHFLTNGTEEDAATFIASLHRRYGRLLHGGLHEESDQVSVESDKLFMGMVPIEAELEYLLQFTNNDAVRLTGKYVLFKSVFGGNEFENRFSWIQIHDEVQGNLVYPADAMKEDSAINVE